MARQRKKRRNPQTDKSIRVSGTISGTNTALVSGDFNTINMQAEPKPINVEPYSDDDYGLIRMGRRLMKIFFHTQNHGLGLFWLIAVILGGISTTVAYLPTGVPDNPILTTSTPGYLGFTVAALLGLAAAMYLALVATWGGHTQCPKCGWKFSKIIQDKVLVNSRTRADGTITENFDVTYACENPACDYNEGPVRKVERYRPEPESHEDDE